MPMQSNTIGPRQFVSVKQAAEYIGVTTRTIRTMIADGRLTGYKSGQRLVRVDLAELDASLRPYGGDVA
jgi:excisionase family DNA binding protein